MKKKIGRIMLSLKVYTYEILLLRELFLRCYSSVTTLPSPFFLSLLALAVKLTKTYVQTTQGTKPAIMIAFLIEKIGQDDIQERPLLRRFRNTGSSSLAGMIFFSCSLVSFSSLSLSFEPYLTFGSSCPIPLTISWYSYYTFCRPWFYAPLTWRLRNN